MRNFLALSIVIRTCVAIVIPAPGMDERVYSPPPSKIVEENPISVRIRSTREADLDGIAQILAAAIVDPYQQKGKGSVNFRLKMDVLRAKAGYGPKLHARWQALREGIKMAVFGLRCTSVHLNKVYICTP